MTGHDISDFLIVAGSAGAVFVVCAQRRQSSTAYMVFPTGTWWSGCDCCSDLAVCCCAGVDDARFVGVLVCVGEKVNIFLCSCSFLLCWWLFGGAWCRSFCSALLKPCSLGLILWATASSATHFSESCVLVFLFGQPHWRHLQQLVPLLLHNLRRLCFHHAASRWRQLLLLRADKAVLRVVVLACEQRHVPPCQPAANLWFSDTDATEAASGAPPWHQPPQRQHQQKMKKR